MKEQTEALIKELLNGRRAVLATIVARRGSAPRGVGVSMTLTQDGRQTGTVGGGSAEHRVKTDARALLQRDGAYLRDYAIHAGEACESADGITVLFRVFSGESGLELLRQIYAAAQSGTDAYLVCNLSDQSAMQSKIMSAEALRSKLGIDPPAHPIVQEGERRYFIEPLMELPRLVLFGGGHVAQMMARQLGLLEYRIWVVEDRPAFAREELFPSAERVICSDFDAALDAVGLTKKDHVIVMSRGHETDYQILRWVLLSEADYIGCIGSKRKIGQIRERLLLDGIATERIDRLHAPIGLPIGAETPAEIAVSVAAELIQYAANR